MNKSIRTRVFTVTCPQCHIEAYSRARHDFRLCGCPAQTMVDGGFDYLRCGGKDITKLVKRIRYVNATRHELYDDWSHMRNKFGLIKKGV